MVVSTVDDTDTSTDMQPHFEEVQAHYDLSDDFFGTFQDPSRTYSCAFYERPEMSLEEAQMAKIDLALGKLDLQPGMTLLDVGCGWGSVMHRAVEHYDVNVVGLTLSRNQSAFGQQLLDGLDTDRTRRVLLRGWEQFDEPVDRIVSVEAFEAFPKERYQAYFETCERILPSGGRMVLQTIMGHPLKRWPEMGIPITMTDLQVHAVHRQRDLPGRLDPVRRRHHRAVREGRIRGGTHAAADRALRPHARHLGRVVGSASRRGGRRDLRRGVPAVHEVSRRLQRFLPAGHQRIGAVHPRQAVGDRGTVVVAARQESTAVAEAANVTDEHLIGAEGVPVRASAGRWVIHFALAYAGFLLRDGTPDEQRRFIEAVPLPLRITLKLLGGRVFASYRTRLYG